MNSTALFTVILDLDGGTYVSQVQAADEYNALELWSNAAGTLGIKGIGKSIGNRIMDELKENRDLSKPVLLNGLINVWSVSLFVYGKKLFINIIKTEG